MNPNVEYIVIGIATGWSGFYLIRRIYRAFKPSNDGCGEGCGCAVTEIKKHKKLS